MPIISKCCRPVLLAGLFLGFLGCGRLAAPPAKVARPECALAAEFPQFQIISAPPYVLITDESSLEAARTLRVLNELRRQFENHFRNLIEPQAPPASIQVVLFGNEADFREYTQRIAPALTDSAGYFAHDTHRLVLLNQLGTERYRQFQNRLTEKERALQVSYEPRAGQQIAAWRSQVTLETQSLTARLIRHEGAHQLLSAYGLQPACEHEPVWLSEGLAQYCEPAEIGSIHPVLADRLVKYHHTGRLLPLAELLSHRDPAGFLALPPDQIEIAYAQSWGLIYRLMQPDFRPSFESLLRAGTGNEAALLQHLNTDLPGLERVWQSFLESL